MRKVIFCCLLLVMFSASGCVVRTYTTQMDRVDQEVYGNRGYIMGTGPSASEETSYETKTREIYNVEIELPSNLRTSQEIRESGKTTDKELYGNRGYVQGSITAEKEVYVTEQGEGQSVAGPKSSTTRLGSMRLPQIVYSEPSASVSGASDSAQKEYYIVQKGDTLQKISQKFYGTTKKWNTIYQANEHILKSPDRIRPGQKLVIP